MFKENIWFKSWNKTGKSGYNHRPTLQKVAKYKATVYEARTRNFKKPDSFYHLPFLTLSRVRSLQISLWLPKNLAVFKDLYPTSNLNLPADNNFIETIKWLPSFTITKLPYGTF